MSVEPLMVGVISLPMVQQGWQCPVCKTVMAPFMPTCIHCKPVTVTIHDHTKP